MPTTIVTTLSQTCVTLNEAQEKWRDLQYIFLYHAIRDPSPPVLKMQPHARVKKSLTGCLCPGKVTLFLKHAEEIKCTPRNNKEKMLQKKNNVAFERTYLSRTHLAHMEPP